VLGLLLRRLASSFFLLKKKGKKSKRKKKVWSAQTQEKEGSKASLGELSFSMKRFFGKNKKKVHW